MGYYLLDHPPATPQFHTSRANPPTWAVSVHTSEGATGPGTATALASFIASRRDPGSYAAIVDSETTVYLVPPDFTTFSVETPGYNSRTWAICLAGRSVDLDPDDLNTQAMIDRAGQSIAALWAFNGVDYRTAAQWIATDALNTAGLFCHGDVQPYNRTDAWSIHPQRPTLDALLIQAIHRHSNPPPQPSEDLMRRFIRPQSSPNVYLTDAGLLGKVHMKSEEALRAASWTLAQSNIPVLAPPAGTKSENIAGILVWVVADDFANSIPTLD